MGKWEDKRREDKRRFMGKWEDYLPYGWEAMRTGARWVNSASINPVNVRTRSMNRARRVHVRVNRGRMRRTRNWRMGEFGATIDDHVRVTRIQHLSGVREVDGRRRLSSIARRPGAGFRSGKRKRKGGSAE